jgi:hypothetical protein
MKRLLVVAATAALLVGTAVVAPTAAHAAPFCGIRWGSTPEAAGTLTPSPLAAVRAGRHPCYDRLVFNLRDGAAGYHVQYVRQVLSEGAGAPIPVRGAADIAIVLMAPAYDVATGVPTYVPANRREVVNVQGSRTFRQVAWGGSFEGYTTIALGVRARLPFRVFTLDGPGEQARLVIDVAHRW